MPPVSGNSGTPGPSPPIDPPEIFAPLPPMIFAPPVESSHWGITSTPPKYHGGEGGPPSIGHPPPHDIWGRGETGRWGGGRQISWGGRVFSPIRREGRWGLPPHNICPRGKYHGGEGMGGNRRVIFGRWSQRAHVPSAVMCWCCQLLHCI